MDTVLKCLQQDSRQREKGEHGFSRVTKAYAVAGGVKSFSQHSSRAHDERGDQDPDDDASVGRGGCRTEGENDGRSGSARSGTAEGGAAG